MKETIQKLTELNTILNKGFKGNVVNRTFIFEITRTVPLRSSNKMQTNTHYIINMIDFLESRDLGPGEVRQVDALGLNLAVFR